MGKFLNDRDKYTEVFGRLTQTYKTAWGDAMLLLNQTLAFSETQWDYKLLLCLEINLTLEAQKTAKGTASTTGNQAVPI